MLNKTSNVKSVVKLTLGIMLFIGAFLLRPHQAGGQEKDRAFALVNQIDSLLEKGDVADAVAAATEAHELAPGLFLDMLDKSYSQKVKSKHSKAMLRLLDGLSEKNVKGLNTTIAPIHSWAQVVATNDAVVLERLATEFVNALPDASSFSLKTERYGLLIVKELEAKKFENKELTARLFSRILTNLESNPILKSTKETGLEARRRAWHRFLLAYCYNHLYGNNNYSNGTLEQRESYIEKSSVYSPNSIDKQALPDYYYDAHLLTDADPIDYRPKFVSHLMKGKKAKKAIQLQVELTFDAPSDKNMELLRTLHMQLESRRSFKTFWYDYINSRGIALPLVKIEFDDRVLDLSVKPERWIYVDIWGTWCQPCIRELPKLQKVYDSNDSDKSGMDIVTFSYRSVQLPEFMASRKFTFPVAEIDEETNNAFKIFGYPTRLLISPQGKYLSLPYHSDWQKHVKNYILHDE